VTTTDSPEAQPQGGELLPCRFCPDGKGETRQTQRYVHPGGIETDHPLYAVICGTCDARGPEENTPLEAERRWNIRADLPRATAPPLAAVYGAIEAALNTYHMRYTKEAPDLEHGLPLVDRLTPDVDNDVTRGREELDDLIDHVCGSVGDLFRAGDDAPCATGETTVEAALDELREMFPKTFIRVRSTTEIEYNEYADQASYRERFAYILVLKQGEFPAQTLADCMAQVRSAAQTKAERGEK
jgi:hypothetical protein